MAAYIPVGHYHANVALGPWPAYRVGDFQHHLPDLRFDYSASLGDYQQVEPVHSEEAQGVLSVMADAVWEKEAFFVPGAPVHLYLVPPRQSEKLGELRDQYGFVRQCGQFLF